MARFDRNRWHGHSEIAMYCYINTYIKSIEKFTAFNFKNLYDHHETKRNKVKHLLHLRKQSGLAITAEEHNWATEWLAGKGFDYQDNKLIVFVFNSSQRSKSLREDVMMHLTGHFASIKSYKVLLFDENREGLGHKCAEKLGEALYRNIIIFEGRGLRQAMALMAHPKVDLIIGPCTGLLHLANGVYNYLLNTGQRLRNHIPSLVVYVGDVKEYSTEYHPKDWWRNTLVKCFIFSKVGSFVSTLWSTSMNSVMLFLALLYEQRRKKIADAIGDSRLAAEREK